MPTPSYTLLKRCHAVMRVRLARCVLAIPIACLSAAAAWAGPSTPTTTRGTITSSSPSSPPDALVAAGVSTTGTLDARFFFGPKDVEVLERTGLGLEKTVNFGWFGILARPLLWLLKRAYAWSGNFGVAICTGPILIRILAFRLMHKA